MHYASTTGAHPQQTDTGESMQAEELKETFDRMAASYDEQWIRVAALRDALHLLMGSTFTTLPTQAKVLCVGAGTGSEIIYLAQQFPQWTFTALDPSAKMLEVCRGRLEERGIADRCEFHADYLESLPASGSFDAATALLVSQFILEKSSRVGFFGLIARQLKPGGLLVSSDLCADLDNPADRSLLEIWLRTMKGSGMSEEDLYRMRAAYGRDVAILPESEITDIIASGGFEAPNQLFQAGLIHAWYSIRNHS